MFEFLDNPKPCGKRILLENNSWIEEWTLLPNEIRMEDDTFSFLWSLPKHNEAIIIMGKHVAAPRYTNNYGKDYFYSGILHKAQPIPHPYLSALLEWICSHSQQPYQQILMNRYEDGRHYIGWHRDDTTQLVKHSAIYSFSFGCPRQFKVRRLSDNKVIHKFTTGNNTLLIMGGAFQTYYQHCVTKQSIKKVYEPRINITFRLFKSNS